MKNLEKQLEDLQLGFTKVEIKNIIDYMKKLMEEKKLRLISSKKDVINNLKI